MKTKGVPYKQLYINTGLNTTMYRAVRHFGVTSIHCLWGILPREILIKLLFLHCQTLRTLTVFWTLTKKRGCEDAAAGGDVTPGSQLLFCPAADRRCCPHQWGLGGGWLLWGGSAGGSRLLTEAPSPWSSSTSSYGFETRSLPVQGAETTASQHQTEN